MCRIGPQRLLRDVLAAVAGADLARSRAGGSPDGERLGDSGWSDLNTASVCVAADVSGSGSQSLSDCVD